MATAGFFTTLSRPNVLFQYKETIVIEISFCFISDSDQGSRCTPTEVTISLCPADWEGQSSFVRKQNQWSKLEDDSTETEVLISMGLHKKSYGNFQDRVYLLEMDDNDATLVITNIDLNDYGTYMCEIINGMNDKITEVDLELQGNFIIS